MRILFVVRALNVGGAQRQLAALARGLRRDGHVVAVAVFYAGGAFEEDVRAEGISVHDLGKRSRWDMLMPLVRLVRLVRSDRPDVVHGYMGLANLASAASKPLFPSGVKVVWGVRTAMSDLGSYDWLSRVGPALDRAVSPLADAVVANSQAARLLAATRIDARKIVVIPNGIDCERFRPDFAGRAEIRNEWATPEGAALVGVVARLDPVKSHATFLRAAARVAAIRGDVRFVCVGGGTPAYRKELERLATELGLGGRLTWAGERSVTSAVYSALDVAVLSSDPGESFPNAVAEAMACGVPCVVSASGDAPVIVGDTGSVVPPGDPEALARALIPLLDRTRDSASALSARARARVVQEYSLQMLVRRTVETLERLQRGG